MPSRIWLRIAELAVSLVFAATFFFSWRADRNDRLQFANELTAAKQALAAADAREYERDSQLSQTLVAIAAQKKSITTPSQIMEHLPEEIPLPTPIRLSDVAEPQPASISSKAPADQSNSRISSTTKSTSIEAPQSVVKSQAVIPAEDLKPLYDFALDCKACQAKLAATQSDLTDEKAKEAALTKERDAAIKTAKGGNWWRRITRAAKWFAIGAAAGAIASKTAH